MRNPSPSTLSALRTAARSVVATQTRTSPPVRPLPTYVLVIRHLHAVRGRTRHPMGRLPQVRRVDHRHDHRVPHAEEHLPIPLLVCARLVLLLSHLQQIPQLLPPRCRPVRRAVVVGRGELLVRPEQWRHLVPHARVEECWVEAIGRTAKLV